MREQDSWDEPDDDLDDLDDSSETLPCPHCGADIYEEAPQCPVCGQYVTFRTSVWSDRPLWWIALAVAGLAATLAALTWLTR